jgi:hypothetical protein
MSVRPSLDAMGPRILRISVLVLITFSFAAAHGGTAAADPSSVEIAGPDSVGDATPSHPMILAGRWSGHRFGYSKVAKADGCKGGSCTLTFDIVPCGTEWCGIAVDAAQRCGSVAMRLKPSDEATRRNTFGGTLELAKGSDPYTIEAWYRAPDEGAGENSAKAALSLIGDTGPELLMMRRSFPLQAELSRVADATCTLEKATS